MYIRAQVRVTKRARRAPRESRCTIPARPDTEHTHTHMEGGSSGHPFRWGDLRASNAIIA